MIFILVPRTGAGLAQGGFQQQNPPLHHRAARTAACRRRQEVGKAAARAGRSIGSRSLSILDAAAGEHPCSLPRWLKVNVGKHFFIGEFLNLFKRLWAVLVKQFIISELFSVFPGASSRCFTYAAPPVRKQL
jgi:hypothetical protein